MIPYSDYIGMAYFGIVWIAMIAFLIKGLIGGLFSGL